MLNSLYRIKYIRGNNNAGNKNMVFDYKSNIIYNNKENSQTQINIPRKNTSSQNTKIDKVFEITGAFISRTTEMRKTR